jgi:hypothetical protein
LQSFLDAHNATDPDQRKAHLKAHVRLLREHIKKLSAKSYWSQFEAAPDFVFLFLPGDHFYNGALESTSGDDVPSSARATMNESLDPSTSGRAQGRGFQAACRAGGSPPPPSPPTTFAATLKQWLSQPIS